MKLAVIPPKSLIAEYLPDRHYHMLLPAALDDVEIRRLYRDVPGYKMLDNGMYEGVMWPDYELIQLALGVRPDEIIMPDIASDFPSTYARQMEFMQMFCKLWPDEGYRPQLMAAIQGETDNDRIQHAMRLLDMRDDYEKNLGVRLSFGFPRNLVKGDNMYARVNIMEAIIRAYGKVPMHMLGLASRFPSEIRIAARQFGPYLRGMDTSAPFTWAIQGEALGSAYNIERPDDYFNLPAERVPIVLANENISILERWCDGQNTPQV